MRHAHPLKLTVHLLRINVIRRHRFAEITVVHCLTIRPHRGGDRRPYRTRQRTHEVRQTGCRRHPVGCQTRQRNCGKWHKEAGDREALNKLWPGRRAKVHARFKRVSAPVETNGIHDETEGDQFPHIKLMGEPTNDGRQDNRDNPDRR